MIKKCALIKSGVIENIIMIDTDDPDEKAFTIPKGMEMLDVTDVDNVDIGQTVEKGAVVVPVIEDAFTEQEILLMSLADYRWKKENAGVELNGIEIQTERASRADILGAYTEAQVDPDYTVKWKTEKGFMELNATQITVIAKHARKHVQVCFEAEAIVEQKIKSDEIADVDELVSVFDEQYSSLMG